MACVVPRLPREREGAQGASSIGALSTVTVSSGAGDSVAVLAHPAKARTATPSDAMSVVALVVRCMVSPIKVIAQMVRVYII